MKFSFMSSEDSKDSKDYNELVLCMQKAIILK